MVKIYLVRHGHSIGNEKDLITGHYDCPLSQTGEKQAELLCDYIVKNLKIDKFYSSNLCRAVDTVKAAAEKMDMPIILEPAFKELSAGKWEGLSFEEAEKLNPKEFRAWVNKEKGGNPPEGESWESLLQRASKRLSELVLENDNKNILICAHGGVIKALNCYFLGWGAERMTDIDWVSNASVSEIWYDGGRYEIKEMSYDDYLLGLKTELPKTV